MKWLCWGQQKRELLELHVCLWKGMHLHGFLQLRMDFQKGPYLWRYGTHIHKTGHSVVENYSSVRKRRIVAKKKKCESVWTGHFIRIRLKIAKRCWLYLNICVCVCKSTFFARFSLSDSRCMSDAITSIKLKQIVEIFWDSRCCLSAWVSAFWARRTKVKWNLCADCKVLIPPIFLKFSYSTLDWTASSWNFGGIFWNI